MNHPIFSNEWIMQSMGYSSGNSVVDYHEKMQDRPKQRILCTVCGHMTPEDEFIEEHNACEDCYLEFLDNEKEIDDGTES